MNPKLIDDKGLKYYEGSNRIEISDYAVIFEHKESKRIISYLKENKSMIHNIASANLEDHMYAVSDVTEQLNSDAEKSYFSKVGHLFRKGDVLVAHQNIKTQEKDKAHFYQVLEIEKGTKIVVMEIQAEVIQFKNHFKAIPLVGLEKENTEVFKVDVIKNSIKTPDGYLAFKAKFNTIKIGGGLVSIKNYEPVAYGLVI